MKYSLTFHEVFNKKVVYEMCKVLIAAYIQKFKGKGELNLIII